MNCREFSEHVLAFTARATSTAMSAEMARHAEACPPCRGRADLERQFDDRVALALARSGGHRELEALLARPPGGERAVERGRTPQRLQIWAPRVAAAAVLVALGTALAWFACIPPFECPYLSAIESVARPEADPAEAAARAGSTGPREHAPPDAPALAAALSARVHPPQRLDGLPLLGELRPVVVLHDEDRIPGVRADYGDRTHTVEVLWTDAGGMRPSDRRRTKVDGNTWWLASENGADIAAYFCEESQALCTVIARSGDALHLAKMLRSSPAK